MDYRDKFYEYTKPLFDEGILKEIYANDRFSVCNVSDAVYALYYFELSKNTRDIPFSFTFDADTMRYFIENELAFLKTVSEFNKQDFEKKSLKLTEKTIQVFRDTKKLTDLNGPTKYIDREFEKEFLNKYAEELKKVEEKRSTSVNAGNETSKSTGGCYIATCVYGSYDCPEVWTLRRFRDYTLDETWYGRAFIKSYYAISPTLVKCFGEKQWFKVFWKQFLDKMVTNLSNKGISNTRYTDKY